MRDTKMSVLDRRSSLLRMLVFSLFFVQCFLNLCVSTVVLNQE